MESVGAAGDQPRVVQAFGASVVDPEVDRGQDLLGGQRRQIVGEHGAAEPKTTPAIG